MELGEEKERIVGSDCCTYVYREEAKVFLDQDNDGDIILKGWG